MQAIKQKYCLYLDFFIIFGLLTQSVLKITRQVKNSWKIALPHFFSVENESDRLVFYSFHENNIAYRGNGEKQLFWTLSGYITAQIVFKILDLEDFWQK